jgi:transmembrane sensor
MDSRTHEDSRITEEAADWLVELNAAGPACHAEFLEWVRRSPEHVREFLAVSGLARKLKGVDPERRIDVNELMGDGGAEIVRLVASAPGPALASPPVRAGSRRIWSAAAGLATIALAGVLWFLYKPDVYSTRVGEQRSFALSDGSLIYLNTNSKARVHLSEGAREVELLAGEALFTVERDATRPFTVRAGATTVQVLGTKFNVYRHTTAETTVSVIEGSVLAGSVPLHAGEQASIRDGAPVAKQPLPDIAKVVAWRERQLVFRNTPLIQVAAEFNRYNKHQIRIHEAATRDRQITGVFAADRPESFVSFMERDEDVRVRRNATGWTIEPTTSQ